VKISKKALKRIIAEELRAALKENITSLNPKLIRLLDELKLGRDKNHLINLTDFAAGGDKAVEEYHISFPGFEKGEMSHYEAKLLMLMLARDSGVRDLPKIDDDRWEVWSRLGENIEESAEFKDPFATFAKPKDKPEGTRKIGPPPAEITIPE